ncbi:HEPN domain-containing protein [Bacillus thuringiensis]|uniref:HEPN domain-containing protein n=1 Tax=Bacillus thuringiensis TaxID=1428 RepID=UPI0021B54FF9|nr:HEPN domain-containing protein [Bacillus thuringiensis]
MVILNAICTNYNPEFKDIREQCMFLDGFTLEVFYPHSIDFEKKDALKAVHHAESILTFF